MVARNRACSLVAFLWGKRKGKQVPLIYKIGRVEKKKNWQHLMLMRYSFVEGGPELSGKAPGHTEQQCHMRNRFYQGTKECKQAQEHVTIDDPCSAGKTAEQ